MTQKATIMQARAVLEKNPRINLHRYPIAIAAQTGNLILTREVESIAAKKLALVAASETHGVGQIVDRLKVTPTEKMADAEIRDHVCKLLFEEPALKRCLIHGLVGNDVATVRKSTGGAAGSILVAVSDGTVRLNGEVPSLSHKRLAGVLAWWVPGTRDVVNGLEEVPAEEDNDDELTDALLLYLSIRPRSGSQPESGSSLRRGWFRMRP